MCAEVCVGVCVCASVHCRLFASLSVELLCMHAAASFSVWYQFPRFCVCAGVCATPIITCSEREIDFFHHCCCCCRSCAFIFFSYFVCVCVCWPSECDVKLIAICIVVFPATTTMYNTNQTIATVWFQLHTARVRFAAHFSLYPHSLSIFEYVLIRECASKFHTNSFQASPKN